MALVSCPECKQQVSTEAVSCPHCGKQLSGTAAPPAAGAPFFMQGSTPPGPEQVLWEGGPSVALVYGQILRVVIRFIIVVIIGYLVFSMGLPALGNVSSDLNSFIEQNGTLIDIGIVIVLALLVLPSVIAMLRAIARIKNTRYRVTNQRIVIESGVFSRALEEIDMRSVDDIEFRQTFLERLFGIGQVFIVSTDKVAPKMNLHGIHDPKNIRELIRSNAYQVSQRQLFTRST
jgi:membrane protein YdbS with pleckstrin-like domain